VASIKTSIESANNIVFFKISLFLLGEQRYKLILEIQAVEFLKTIKIISNISGQHFEAIIKV
jgi:hypothetical protein